MTGNNPTIEVLSGPERRRRWTTAEKLAMVEETYAPDVTVSLVARRKGVQPNQLFHWRKLAARVALHRARKAHAEWLCQELQRPDARRAFEREPVFRPRPCAQLHCRMLPWLQIIEGTQRLQICSICL
jgi:transposase-like protein